MSMCMRTILASDKQAEASLLSSGTFGYLDKEKTSLIFLDIFFIL